VFPQNLGRFNALRFHCRKLINPTWGPTEFSTVEMTSQDLDHGFPITKRCSVCAKNCAVHPYLACISDRIRQPFIASKGARSSVGQFCTLSQTRPTVGFRRTHRYAARSATERIGWAAAIAPSWAVEFGRKRLTKVTRASLSNSMREEGLRSPANERCFSGNPRLNMRDEIVHPVEMGDIERG
jgi:hypothetical protein